MVRNSTTRSLLSADWRRCLKSLGILIFRLGKLGEGRRKGLVNLRMYAFSFLGRIEHPPPLDAQFGAQMILC